MRRRAQPRVIEPRWLTVVVSLSTFALAIATIWLVWESRQGSYRSIGVESWMHLEERWDSLDMKKARYELASAIEPAYDPSKRDDIAESVPDFFESVGSVWEQGLVNAKLAEMSFSYEAVGWWKALQPWVMEERRRQNDRTTYDKFEHFAAAMQVKYGDVDVAEFLSEQESPTSTPEKPVSDEGNSKE